jgi:hypothetical protein
MINQQLSDLVVEIPDHGIVAVHVGIEARHDCPARAADLLIGWDASQERPRIARAEEGCVSRTRSIWPMGVVEVNQDEEALLLSTFGEPADCEADCETTVATRAGEHIFIDLEALVQARVGTFHRVSAHEGCGPETRIL